jgi:hypothetical protein
MAATMWIEMESGTGCTPVHPHNGYWAGDFSVAAENDRPQNTAVATAQALPGTAWPVS